MNIRYKPLDSLKKEDFREPAEGWADREDLYLDFKRDHPFSYLKIPKEKTAARARKSEYERFEFAKDVAALANAQGGDLVLGIGEEEGAIGIEVNSIDAFQRRVKEVIRVATEPPVRVDVRCVDGFERGPVAVVRVPGQWSGPVSVVGSSSGRWFYLRQGNANSEMTMDEIRESFRGGAEFEERLEEFRRARVRKVVEGRAGAPLTKRSDGVEGRAVLHIQPLSERFPGRTVPVDGVELRPPGKVTGWNPMRTIEGALTWAGVRRHNEPTEIWSYTLGLRSRGVLESVDTRLVELNEGRKVVHPNWLLISYMPLLTDVAPTYFETIGVRGPYLIQLSLLGFDGVKVPQDKLRRREHGFSPIMDPVVFLPGIVIEDLEDMALDDLLPLIDLICASLGVPTPNPETLREWQRHF